MRDFHDPSGNFLIEVQDGQIIVQQTTPGSGEIVACYSGKIPLKLIREICSASPAIIPEHIGYLGRELQKARECLQSDQAYIQDR